MSTKYILPVGLLVAGGAAGFIIWRRMTSVPPQLMPSGGLAPAQPGLRAQFGRFNIFVPLQGITDIVSAVVGGGTKPEKKTTAPAVATVPTGPTLTTKPDSGEPYIMPYMPGVAA